MNDLNENKKCCPTINFTIRNPGITVAWVQKHISAKKL